SVKTGNNARNGGKNSLNRLIRCVCGKKIGPDPRNFNQRVSLGRNDLLIRTFPRFVECYSTILSAKINIQVAKFGKCDMQTDESQAYIFRPYITVKGKRITRPNGGMFKIPINREKKK
ncbi:hypothetical protein, partial [Klebsiella quasipneumoniae]|uniref:hypothetical protein n=2 Tax=Klebsiella pneumoniae complex TaxID=3390273 RepID=UPI001C4724AD